MTVGHLGALLTRMLKMEVMVTLRICHRFLQIEDASSLNKATADKEAHHAVAGYVDHFPTETSHLSLGYACSDWGE